MRYAAKVSKDGKYRLVEFLDCPGCATQADPGEDVEAVAKDVLEGWLEANLVNGRVPPAPRKHRGDFLWVGVSPLLALKIQLRAAREERGWTQKQLGDRIGVGQSMVVKLEDPDQNVTIETAAKAAAALGMELDLSLKKA